MRPLKEHGSGWSTAGAHGGLKMPLKRHASGWQRSIVYSFAFLLLVASSAKIPKCREHHLSSPIHYGNKTGIRVGGRQEVDLLTSVGE